MMSVVTQDESSSERSRAEAGDESGKPTASTGPHRAQFTGKAYVWGYWIMHTGILMGRYRNWVNHISNHYPLPNRPKAAPC